MTINAAKQEVQGWDFSAQWRSPATAGGRFGVNFTGTYLDKWKQSDALNTEYPNYVGTRGSSGAIPRWRHNITLDWTLGPWGATLGQTFQLGYTEPSAVTDSGERRVGDYSIWDLQGRYNGFKNLALTLGIKNLLDTPPPFSPRTTRSRSASTRRTAIPVAASSTARSSTRSSNRQHAARSAGGLRAPCFFANLHAARAVRRSSRQSRRS